ncbi:MAG: N-acetylmuramoyl-L-alanine amidase [Pseudomonadota bacterium]
MFQRLVQHFVPILLCLAIPALADDAGALARLDGARSEISADRAATEIRLELSQPVPWRLVTAEDPPRLAIDFNTLRVDGDIPGSADLIAGVESGLAEDGWARLVFTLTGPAAVETAALNRTPSGASLSLRLIPTTEEAFAANVRGPATEGTAPQPRERSRPLVMLDPGHGGLDPGAEAGSLNEKELMLAFARELEEALIRSGFFDVALTRDRDEFVPLDRRITRARAAGADVFVSLHADEVPEGTPDVSGITVYTLGPTSSDEVSQRLAERHDRDDLLSGVTLPEPGDEIAVLLMDLARQDTQPRSQALAATLRTAFEGESLAMAPRPLRSAEFSVLRAPDIPSVLIELGFLSSAADRARLVDPEWREAAIRALMSGLGQWALEDAARTRLLRR